MLCGHIGCSREVLSAGKKQTARRGCAAAGLQGRDSRLRCWQPARPPAPSHPPAQGSLPGPPGSSAARGPDAVPRRRGGSLCPPPRAEAEPEPRQRPSPATASPGVEEDGPRSALDVACAGRCRTRIAAPQEPVLPGQEEHGESLGQLQHPSTLAGTTGAGAAAGQCHRHLGKTSGSRRPDEDPNPGIWRLWEQPGAQRGGPGWSSRSGCQGRAAPR